MFLSAVSTDLRLTGSGTDRGERHGVLRGEAIPCQVGWGSCPSRTVGKSMAAAMLPRASIVTRGRHVHPGPRNGGTGAQLPLLAWSEHSRELREAPRVAGIREAARWVRASALGAVPRCACGRPAARARGCSGSRQMRLVGLAYPGSDSFIASTTAGAVGTGGAVGGSSGAAPAGVFSASTMASNFSVTSAGTSLGFMPRATR